MSRLYAARVRPRDVVDYALQRRARLEHLRCGRASRLDACDAHPYLKMAARHHGEHVARRCPVCGSRGLRSVHYVYGDNLGHVSGQAKTRAELARMARLRTFTVYAVEVCLDCSWNHLLRSFRLGVDDTTTRRSTSAAADG